MKTKFFRKNKIVKTWRAASLLAALLCPIVLTAQNGVTVSGLAVDAGTVTFNVRWNKNTMPVALWSDTVWVFVDYNNNGVMTRLPLLPGATLTTTSPGGKVIEETGNNKGVWVMGNARTNGNFSATVKLLYNAAATNVAGACAYASNYPPVGKYISGTELSFTGTPPYEIVLKDSKNGTITRESGSPFSVPASYTVQSFSDKTGAPGKIKCLVPVTFTLTASASGFCTGDAGITFALSGTENGRDYQLLRGATPVRTLPGTGSAATFSGAFNVAGVYTAVSVADADGVYCSVSMAGSHTVSEYPLPAITHSGGDASQTVEMGTAITAITYTASNATGIALSNGSFPTGVTGTANGLVFTISGTPSVVGSFGYAVTASHTNGCAGAAAFGAITVNPPPPDFYSSSTWSYGGYTWSDRVVGNPMGCSKVDTFSQTNTQSPPPQYKIYNHSGVERYYFNWTCAMIVCTTGWSLPTEAQYAALTSSTSPSVIYPTWGKGGVLYEDVPEQSDTAGYWWSASDAIASEDAYNLLVWSNYLKSWNITPKRVGFQVRCVR